MNYKELKDWITEVTTHDIDKMLAPLALVKIVEVLKQAESHKLIRKEQRIELHRYAMKRLKIQEEK